MGVLTQLLIEYGYWGMFLAALLAGSILPFGSEPVMMGLIAAGLDPWGLIIYATIGNVLGSILNYYIGTLGNVKWIEKYLHIDHQKMEKATAIMTRYGPWSGFLAFLPVIGDAISVVLGVVRANMWISFCTFTIGKIVRYLIIAYSMKLFMP